MMNGNLTFSEVDEINVHGTWKAAPPEAPPTQGKETDLFLACNRSYPSRGSDDDYTWIELRDSGLIATVRSVFPNASSLYDKKPGVSVSERP